MELNKKILVVEDEERAQRELKELLENHGYSVITASDEKLALSILREESSIIDLIILDIIMPNSDTGGIKLLQKIRKMEEKEEIRPEIPVIFITVKSQEEVEGEIRGYGKGVKYEGFFRKPLVGKKIDHFLALTSTLSIKRSENTFTLMAKKHKIKTSTVKELFNEFISSLQAQVSIQEKRVKPDPLTLNELVAKERKQNNECYNREINRLLNDHRGKYAVIAKGEVQGVGETEDEVMNLCMDDPNVHHRLLFKIEQPKRERITLGWRLRERR